TDYQSEVAQTYLAVATLQAGAGQADAAATSYQNGVQRQRAAVAAAPQVAEYSRLLGRLLAGQGQVQRQLGKPADTKKCYEEARGIFEKLPRQTAADLFDLARIHAACAALAGQGKAALSPAEKQQQKKETDLALASVRQALAGGYHDAERLKKEPEFDDLRGHKELQDLIAEMRHRSKGIPWN